MRAWVDYLKVDGWDSNYRSVSVFLGHYKRLVRSEGTREQVCDVLMRFCKLVGKDPDMLVKLEPEEAARLVQGFVDGMAERGLSIRTVNVALAFLKVFFRVNGFKGDRALEVERYHQPSRYRKRGEYVPTADEIQRMALCAGSLRNKAMVLALFTSGLRNSTLRALLYRDVKNELGKCMAVKIPVTPEMKRVVPGACKGNIPYYTFVSKEVVQALEEYLGERRKLNGGVGDDEPLFASTSSNVPLEVRRRTPVKKRSLDEIVKRSARRAGVTEWRNVVVHSLRKAFETALRNNGLDVKDQEFLMGHILPGTQDPYYDSSKVEDLRAKYQKIDFFRTRQIDKLEMIKDFAKTLGIDKIDIKIQKLKEKEPDLDENEALGRVMRGELGIKILDSSPRKEKNEQNNALRKQETRIVDEDKLVSFLNKGWSIIRELKNGRLVIERQQE